MESSSQSKSLIYDEIRKKWIVATPEELVRQRLLKKMMDELSFPRELISVEKRLSEMPHLAHYNSFALPSRRMDVVCFGKGIHPECPLYPLLVIECKEDAKEASSAMEQVMGYNHYLQAYFVAIAYPEGIQVGYKDKQTERYSFLSYLPPFKDLLQSVSCGR